MISWQTSTEEVGQIEAPSREPCKVCSDSNKATYSVQQSYFSLFWLPVCPTARTVYRICPKCNARLKVKNADHDFDWINRNILRKFNLRYYWGIFVLAGVIFAAVSYYRKITS